MKSCGSLVLLANVLLISVSNADICITGSSTSNNQQVFGNYIQEGNPDSNGNIYFVKKDFCDTLYLNQIFDKWRVYTSLSSSIAYIRCQQENLVLPADCTSWTNFNSTDLSIKASTIACPGLATPSLSCGAIEIDMSGGNWLSDGIYSKIDNNLYKYTYQSTDYYFQFYIKGEYYVIAGTDSRESCSNPGPSAYVRSYDRKLDNIKIGESLTLTSSELDHPSDGRTVTFTCLQSAPTSAPTIAPANELCFAVKCDNPTSVACSFNGVRLLDIAGKYSLITDPNGVGYPAYQLSNDCDSTYYIVYVPKYGRFMILSDLSNPDSYSLYCTNISTDFNSCQWNSDVENDFDLVDNNGDGCECGLVNN